jgi:DNA/RNA endonuclease YhcR with UshA esterase domain
MSLNFESFQDKLVEGTLEGCFVNYKATVLNNETGDISYVKVAAEKDELIDFDSAVTDEACEPIAEEIEAALDDEYEVVELEVKFIMTKVANADGSVTYVAFTTDGSAHTINLSAQEVFEETLEALFN